MRSIRLLALSASVLVALPVAAAVQVHQSIKPGDGSAPVERKLTLSGKRMRIDEGTWSLIADAATGKVVQLQHDKKTWSESVTPERLGVAQDPVSTRFAAAFVKSLSRVSDQGVITVRPTEETRTIAGVAAKRADVYRDGVLVRKGWYAESLLDEDLFQFQTMLQATEIGSLFYEELAIATRAALLGFPVRTENLESGSVMEAVEIRREAPAASVFAPPAGYRKLD